MSNPYDPQQPQQPRPGDEAGALPPQAPVWPPAPATQPVPSGGYGAPPAGAGGYGAPQPGYGPPADGYGGAPGGPGRQGTSGLAIASLVTGLLGFLCLTAVAAIVLGVVALTQIGRTGRKGKGLAIAGIVLGVLWLLAGVLAIPAAISQYEESTSTATSVDAAAPSQSPSPSDAPTQDPTTEPTAEPTTEPTTEPTEPAQPPGDVAVVVAGDCIADPAILQGVDVPQSAVVDCATPHFAEAYAQFDLPEGDFPGEEAVTAAAGEGCDAEFLEFIGVGYQESELEVFYYYPTEEVWVFDRSVVCVVLDPAGEPVTGSLQGADR